MPTSDGKASRNRKLRVVCAFKNASLQDELTRRLAQAGYAALAVGSSVELLDSVVQHGPDLVLMDARLSGQDGVELVEAVRNSGTLGAEVPLVLFAGDQVSPDLERRTESLGVRVWRGKKLGTRTLRAVVEQALSGCAPPGEGELLSLCERLRDPNPFVALGVPMTSDLEVIRAGYERLRRSVHPDALGETSSEVRRMARVAFEDLERAWAKVADAASLARYCEAPDADADPKPDFDASEPSREGEARMAAPPEMSEAETLYREGLRLLDQQNWSDALTAFQQASQAEPDNGEYRAHVGWALYLVYGAEPSVIEEAIEHAREGMKLSPNRFQTALLLGKLYALTDRLDLAEKALKRAVALNPDSVESVRELRTLRSRPRRSKGLLSRLLRR